MKPARKLFRSFSSLVCVATDQKSNKVGILSRSAAGAYASDQRACLGGREQLADLKDGAKVEAVPHAVAPQRRLEAVEKGQRSCMPMHDRHLGPARSALARLHMHTHTRATHVRAPTFRPQDLGKAVERVFVQVALRGGRRNVERAVRRGHEGRRARATSQRTLAGSWRRTLTRSNGTITTPSVRPALTPVRIERLRV